MSRSIDFFEGQFRGQISAERTLNPFEQATLPHLRGEVLDLGCGLGNLALAAAELGCRVTALDAAPTAITCLQSRAAASGLAIRTAQVDLSNYRITRQYDAIVCIGLLMFFDCRTAVRLLGEIHDSVRPGGVAAVNVLIEGTTYREMFDPGAFCLFERDALTNAFAAWQMLHAAEEDFPAPGNTRKAFSTVIARKQAS